MIRYIALLRGINVSGQKIIKMEALKNIFESLKLKNVKTYIQSGNVIFDASEKNSVLLNERIEKHLNKSLGYKVSVMLRTVTELGEIIKLNPYKKIDIDKDIHLYVSFLIIF